MKIQVLHDSAGNILGILAPVEGRRRGRIGSPDPDMTVVEVDAPDLSLSSEADANEESAAALAALMQDYVIDSGRLVARSERSASS